MKQTTTSWRASDWRRMADLLCAVAALSFLPGRSPAATPIAVAVADFDYFDTSGEVADQSAEHRTRVASGPKLLRDDLAAQGDYRVVSIECRDHPCTATSLSQEVFIAAVRKAGAGWWSMAASAR